MIVPFLSSLKSSNVNLSPLIQPPDAPVILNGCTNAWKLGAIIKDTGYFLIDAQIRAGKTIGGLFNFVQNPTTEKMLVTLDNAAGTDTELYYRASGAGSWTEIPGAETAWTVAGQKVEMVGFIGYCFFVGYNSTADTWLPVGSLTGTTFSTATNVTSMPQGKYIVRYRDRLYVLNVRYGAANYPYRIVASSIPVAGAITWSTSGDPTDTTGGFLDVDYSYQITGGSVNWDRLVVFTDYNAYLYDGSSFKQVWATGCVAHRTIKNHGAYMIWANSDGVWVSTGGQPQNISGEMVDFFRNSSSPTSWFAEITDEVYCIYLGSVTVNGRSYTNCELRFNIAVSTWEAREWAGSMAIYANYFSSGKKIRYMGNADGQVWQKAKYTDSTLVSGDAQATAGTGGTAIRAEFELAPIILNSLDQVKRLKSIIAYAERAQNVGLYARIIDKNSRVLMPYKPLGRLTQYINSFDVNVDDGVIIQISGSEYSTAPYFSFLGYALDIESEGEILKPTYK